MQFTLTDTQIEIKENATKLLKENIELLNTIKKVDENCRLDKKIWKLISEQGWLALDVSEEDGGLGFFRTDTAILSEVVGYYMPIVPIFSSGVVFKNLILNSRNEIKDKFLQSIITGEKIGTFAVYENNNYEVNTENLKTKAEAKDNSFVLNGSKKYAMFADTSDYLIVLAEFNGSFKFIVIESKVQGISIDITPSLDQTRPMCDVNFSDVVFSEENFLTNSEDDLELWKTVINTSIGYLAMEQVGASQACLDMATNYAKERLQFGRPIGSFQAVQHICANMLVQLESAKSVAYSAIRADDTDKVEVEMSAMLAKSYCSEVFNKIAGDNIQVHGGIGFTWEHPAHLYFKKAKSDSLLFGTPKTARDSIAKLLSL